MLGQGFTNPSCNIGAQIMTNVMAPYSLGFRGLGFRDNYQDVGSIFRV